MLLLCIIGDTILSHRCREPYTTLPYITLPDQTRPGRARTLSLSLSLPLPIGARQDHRVLRYVLMHV